MSGPIIYYDVAAAAIMTLTSANLLTRRVKRGQSYYAYFALVVIVMLTALFEMWAVLYDNYFMQLLIDQGVNSPIGPQAIREVLHIVYFALRSLNLVAYVYFIAVMADATYRLRRNWGVRIAVWMPLAIELAIILTNPLHQGIFVNTEVSDTRGPLMWTVYALGVYYMVWGVVLILRWRKALGHDKARTLTALYPLNLVAVLLQTYTPELRVEMFFTAMAVLLLSTFVIRPEEDVDLFTGTLNLQAFEESCRRAFIVDRPLCLVYIDIANKERLRQLVGPGAYRNIVRAVASQVGTYLKDGDLLYYLRNGLFCISAHDPDADQSLAIAQRSSREGREAAEALPEQAMAVQLRTCVVRVPEDASDQETLQTFARRIPQLMPEPIVTTYEELSQHPDFPIKMNLADIVSRGITARAFEVHYQPIWCVSDGLFHSAEALVRLNDPTYGYVSPALFIPEAEQSGAVLDVGRITLEKIFEFLGEVDFAATHLHYVEVNLSVDQCVQPGLTREVLGLLERYDVAGSRINLEVTETSSSYSQAAIESNVRALAAEGISLSLDDFGSGYSSLARMLALPFDIVKVDKTLVDAMDDPATHTVLADTIGALKKIGKQVLVEGVETEEQSRQLVEMGVDYIQGYLYAKPMPEAEFVAFLKEHNAG